MKEIVRQIATEEGFDVVGFTDPVISDEVSSAFDKWLKSGLHAGMKFLKNNQELRSDPHQLLPGVKSVIVLLTGYYNEDTAETPEGFGRIAGYAWGKDYHQVINQRLDKVIDKMSCTFEVGKEAFVKTVDTKPVPERYFAFKAGLGIQGNNSFIISPTLGTYHFISLILTSLEFESDDVSGIETKCSGCGRCQTECPTGAIIEPGVIDANRCISYATIEHKDEIPSYVADKISDQLFGCDICQTVCTHNRALMPCKTEEFKQESGPGKFLRLKDILEINSNSEYRKLFDGTSLMRTGLKRLKRNAQLLIDKNKKKQ